MSRWWYVVTKTPSKPNLKMMTIVREFTQLVPRPYLDRRRLITPDPSNPTLTPPTKTLRMSGICGPRHISTAAITLHLTSKQANVL
jgi:hypothetical protein